MIPAVRFAGRQSRFEGLQLHGGWISSSIAVIPCPPQAEDLDEAVCPGSGAGVQPVLAVKEAVWKS
jgi:hypothetical protein